MDGFEASESPEGFPVGSHWPLFFLNVLIKIFPNEAWIPTLWPLSTVLKRRPEAIVTRSRRRSALSHDS